MDYNKLWSGFQGLDGKTPREKQLKAVDLFTRNTDKKNIVYQMPTGSGKSVLGVTLGLLTGKTAYLCSSIQLQDQLHEEFSNVGKIKGRRNYVCMEHGGDCSECLHTADMPCCSRYECEYQKAKRVLFKKDIQVMNYDFFLTMGNLTDEFDKQLKNSKGSYDLIVCDEADVLEEKLTGFVTIDISKSVLTELGLTKPSRVSNQAKDIEGIWKKWAEETLESVDTFIDTEMSIVLLNKGLVEDTKEWISHAKRYTGLLWKLDFLAKNVNKSWLFEDKQDRYEFKPLWMSRNLFQQIMGRLGKKFVFMSGSLPSKEVFCGLIGIDKDDTAYAKTSSDVPVENRPIYCMYKGSMGKKNQGESLPKVVRSIEEIFDKHPDEKGIVHTVSFKLQSDIYNSLGKGYRKRCFLHEQGSNKVERLEMFKSSNKSLVFFSPSSSRGVDLPDDLCRFIVIPKVPYGYLGDKLIQSRFYSGQFGKQWYSELAVQEMIQMMGRGIRSVRDYASVYVLDTDARRMMNSKNFPKWMMEGKEVVK